jgi:5-methyltetrahydrofolate--homocysteine methyltransferase
MEEQVKKIYNGVLEGQHKQVVVDVQAALDAGINPVTVLNEGMIAAMAEVGRLFEVGEYYVPEMLISARAMQSGLAVHC